MSGDTGVQSYADQLPKNIFANIAYFLANIIIGILLVPYFVSQLGVAAYGLIPLATSITGYVAIVVYSLNAVVSRYLTIDLQKGDYAAANRTFNTALFGLSAIILLMIPVVFVLSWLAPSIFSIPVGQEREAVLLLLGVCAAFLIRSWTGNFTVQLFAYNRLDLQNIVNLINLLTQTVLIIFLFNLFGPDLALVGGAYFAGAIIASIVSIALARRICPYIKVTFQAFDRTRVKDLCGMGCWVVIQQIGGLFLLQSGLILANLFFGAGSAGEYAIALQFGIALRAFAGLLSGVLTPTIFSYYARGQTELIILITKSAIKLIGVTMALPIGLVCGFAPNLLAIWVGDEYRGIAALMILLTAHLTINLSVLPVISIRAAYNQVKFPSIISIFAGIINVLLALWLSLNLGWGIYGVAAATVIVLTITNTLFNPWYTARILNIPTRTFLNSMLPGCVMMVVVIGAGRIINAYVEPLSLIAFTILGCGISIIYIIIVYMFVLNHFEHNYFNSQLSRYIQSCILLRHT